jgi:hypothetical protein
MFRKPTSVLLALIMSHAFLALLSPSKSAKLMVARAFTTNSHASHLLSTRTCRLPGAPAFATTTTSPASRLYTSTSHVAANVEEDLDAALDDILGEALQEAEEPLDTSKGGHIEGAKPMPAAVVELVSHVMFRKTCCVVQGCFSR